MSVGLGDWWLLLIVGIWLIYKLDNRTLNVIVGTTTQTAFHNDLAFAGYFGVLLLLLNAAFLHIYDGALPCLSNHFTAERHYHRFFQIFTKYLQLLLARTLHLRCHSHILLLFKVAHLPIVFFLGQIERID